jgi:GNAT superfamily N-acetyltransferase
MSAPFIIRPAVLQDLPLLLLFQQGVVEAERPFDPTLRPGELSYYDIEALLISPQVCLLVAEQQGQVIGSGYARIEEAKLYLRHSHYAYLGFMYVRADYRGQGVNTQILGALRQWAAARGLTEMRLDVYVGNAGAVQAYEKFGFRPHVLEMRLAI